MTEDRSLDDFLDASDDQHATAHGDEDDGGVSDADASDDPDGKDDDAFPETGPDAADDATDESLSPAAVDGATPTYDWSPEGVECETCGTSVERRWRQESALVCEDCKDW